MSTINREKISSGIPRILLLTASIGFSQLLVIFMLLTGKQAALPALSAMALIFILILIDIDIIKDHDCSSWLFPLILVAPPAYSFLNQSANLLANIAGWIIFIFYYLLLPRTWKVNLWRRVVSMGLPLMFFLICLLIADAMNGTLPSSNDLFRSDGNTLATWLGAVGYYLAACLYCKDGANIRSLLWFMMVIALLQPLFDLQALTGLLSFVPGMSVLRVSGINSQYGSFRDLELLAENMVISIIWVAAHSFSKNNWKAYLSSGFMLFAFGFTGIITGARSFVGFTVAGVLMVFVLSLMRTKKVNRSLWFLAVIIVTSMGVWAILPGWVGDWFNFRIQETQTEFATGNYFNRAPLYAATISMAQDMPFFGYGGNSNDKYHAFLISETNSLVVNPNINSPHSMFSWALLTSGYPGFLALVILFGSALYYGYKIWRTGRYMNKSLGLLSIGLIVSIVIMILDEMKIEFSRLNIAMFYFVVMFGVISAWFSLRPNYTDTK